MSLSRKINWDALNKILSPVDETLGSDLEALRRKDARERTDLWNRIVMSQNTYNNEFLPALSPDLRNELSSKFRLARLFLAAALWINNEDSPTLDEFNQKELDLVQDFERFNVFDVLTIEEIVQRIARREDIYELIVDFYQKQYSDLDTLLDDPDIQRDLKLAFKNQYKKRLEKIAEGVKAYVGLYGPVIIITQIEKKIWDKIKESEGERKRIADELESQIREISSIFSPASETDSEGQRLNQKLSELVAELATGWQPKDLESLETQKDALLGQYISLERGLSSRIDVVEQQRKELENREHELEQDKQEYQSQLQEEKQRLVESELNEISVLKSQLLDQEESIDLEKREFERKREELESRLQEINDILEGKPIRIIAGEAAKLCELNYISRFETKMENLPLKIYSPVENRSYTVRSWKDNTHLKFMEDVSVGIPGNIRSRYSISEKKYGFFGEKINKVVFEAVSLNHLEEYKNYGYDARRANIADFLGVIMQYIKTAEMGKYLHVLGIASPTGWDERVKKQIESTEFTQNYVSKHVSICIIDSATGDVFYNPTDERISEYIDFFKPQFDRERVMQVKSFILDKLNRKDYVVYSDIVEETNEVTEIINKAFYDLESEGEYRIRMIKDVGIVLEIKKQ